MLTGLNKVLIYKKSILKCINIEARVLDRALFFM